MATRTNRNMLGSALFYESMKEAALYFNQLIPKEAKVFCWAAGIFPFFIDAATYDGRLLGGLGDKRNYDFLIMNRAPDEHVAGAVRYPLRPTDPRLWGLKPGGQHHFWLMPTRSTRGSP